MLLVMTNIKEIYYMKFTDGDIILALEQDGFVRHIIKHSDDKEARPYICTKGVPDGKPFFCNSYHDYNSGRYDYIKAEYDKHSHYINWIQRCIDAGEFVEEENQMLYDIY